jgi:hypothetical protein
MDLVIAVVLGNCAISIVILVITVGTIRLRRQAVGLTHFCDRCLGDWDRCLGDWDRSTFDPEIGTGRSQIHQLRQLYQQQLTAIDRVRTLRSIWGVARFLLFKRR